jgi:hypothetical protein
MSNKLSVGEWAQLRERETIIKDGEQVFIRVGTALAEIRDLKLYREKFGTFQEYVEQRLGWTRQRAYQVMEAAKVVKELPPKMSSMLDTARAAEAVAKVPQDQREQVLAEAAKAGPVTAASVQQAAAKVYEGELVLTDATELARTVPTEIAADWKRADATAKDILHKLRDVLHAIDEGLKAEDSIYADTTNGELSPLKAVIGHVNLHVKPHAVCSICHGLKSRKSCKLCKGRGYIGRHLWQTCVDSDTKALLAKMGGAK